MTDTRFFAILAAMTAAAISVSAYDIDLEPDAAKRRTVTVFKSQGPQTASLYLKAPSPWVIAGSAITAQDDSLWSAVSTTPNTRTHVYQMVNAHSSQQHVSIFGFLTQPGPGPGRNPWFKATVPAVDIDWEAHSGAGHESDEDAWTGLCPVTTDQSRRSKIIVRPLKDDFSLVSGWMTLECWPTDAVRFLKEDGATALWHGASVSYSETPLTLYVDPVPEKAGPFTVTLKGDMDDAFNRPTDYLTGRAVLLDLDVDADNNGAIGEADDPLEEAPGGILATGTVKQVALRLAPTGLTGTLKLLAVSGGSHIRLWRDAGKTSSLALSEAEWNLSGGYTFPTALYVEGIDASAAVRDVHLCLRYTAAEDQYLDDNIRLTILSVDLKEVSFSGTKYHTVKKDDGSQDYAAPHWQDNSSPLNGDADDAGDKKYPICFTRNTKMKVSAKWNIEPSGLGVTIKVKGDGPGNLDFPETTATISGNVLTITDVECSNPFANEVDFFDPMSITWSFSMDGGSTWCNAGTSANQTYVTLGDPLTTVFHTLAHLGCKNADSENTEANCTSKIWSEFTDRDVRRVDGVQLTYYASYTCGNVTTASLLANGDGQCGSWAKFFIDMRKVQGIDDTDEYVIFEPMADDGFCAKNWTFTGAGSSGHATYPYLNLPDSPLVGATSYNWKFSEVDDATGIPGQGNANPASLFNNHQVVISGQYYDPSYGVQHATLQVIDDNAIDGFYIGPGTYPVDEPTVNLDLNGDGDKTDMGVNTTVMLFRKNPAGLNIKETKVNY